MEAARLPRLVLVQLRAKRADMSTGAGEVRVDWPTARTRGRTTATSTATRSEHRCTGADTGGRHSVLTWVDRTTLNRGEPLECDLRVKGRRLKSCQSDSKTRR